MKLTAALLTLLLPLAVYANPISSPDAAPEAEPAALEARNLSCKITGDGVRYRRCPSTTKPQCDAVGEYAKGTRVTFTCYNDHGSPVHDDKVWYKTTAGYYVSGWYIGSCTASTVGLDQLDIADILGDGFAKALQEDSHS